MKDILNSFKATLYERTSNPLIGVFFFYWCICNYKLIMIFFDGDMKLDEKFKLINDIYPQEKYTFWTGFDIYYYTILGTGFLIPLLMTLTYIFIIPYPIKYIFRFSKSRQKELKRIKYLIDEDTPIGEEKVKELRNNLNDLQKKYYLQIEEITNLRTLINDTEDLPNILPKKNKINSTENSIQNNYEKSLPPIISDKDAEILTFIGNGSDVTLLSIENIPNIFQDKIEYEYYLDNLFMLDLIELTKDSEYVVLSSKGKETLIHYREYEEIPF